MLGERKKRKQERWQIDKVSCFHKFPLTLFAAENVSVSTSVHRFIDQPIHPFTHWPLPPSAAAPTALVTSSFCPPFLPPSMAGGAFVSSSFSVYYSCGVQKSANLFLSSCLSNSPSNDMKTLKVKEEADDLFFFPPISRIILHSSQILLYSWQKLYLHSLITVMVIVITRIPLWGTNRASRLRPVSCRCSPAFSGASCPRDLRVDGRLMAHYFPLTSWLTSFYWCIYIRWSLSVRVSHWQWFQSETRRRSSKTVWEDGGPSDRRPLVKEPINPTFKQLTPSPKKQFKN